jgi:polyribonucleotide 5'-hydroxyl-kinase
VDVLLVLGSEQLYKDLKTQVGDAVTTVKLEKSTGCVDRDESYMQELRQNQIREYFFGYGAINLAPHTILAEISSLAIYQIISGHSSEEASTSTGLPGLTIPANDDDEDDFYEPSATISPPIQSSTSSHPSKILEKVTPSNQMQNSLLAVTFANPNASLEQIAESAVMGYVYVAEVDEAKRKVKLLSPVGGAVPRNSMLWGGWPESVVSLVS